MCIWTKINLAARFQHLSGIDQELKKKGSQRPSHDGDARSGIGSQLRDCSGGAAASVYGWKSDVELFNLAKQCAFMDTKIGGRSRSVVTGVS